MCIGKAFLCLHTDGCTMLCVVTLHMESCFSPVTEQALCYVCVVC